MRSNIEQYRNSIGQHEQWRKRYQPNQNIANRLAATPGSNSNNHEQQQLAQTFLAFLTLCSSVQNSSAVSLKRADEMLLQNKLIRADSIHQGEFVKQGTSRTENTTKTSNTQSNTNTRQHHTGNINKTQENQDTTLISYDNIKNVIQYISQYTADTFDHFITNNDPLKFNIGAEAHPIPESRTTVYQSNRDTEPYKKLDLSCLNQNSTNFGNFFRETADFLKEPITHTVTKNQQKIYLSNGRGCPPPHEYEKLANLTKTPDAIISSVGSMSRSSYILQNIVSPMLEMIADHIDGRNISADVQFDILQNINQQIRFDTEKINVLNVKNFEKQQRTNKFSINKKTGQRHITLKLNDQTIDVDFSEEKGKFFAKLPEGIKTSFIESARPEVYYNYATKKWYPTGNGRFNRFSKKERGIVNNWSLGKDYSTNIEIEYIHGERIYLATNFYTSTNRDINKIDFISAIVMFGQLVPYRYDPNTKQHFIYDASGYNQHTHEVTFVNGEWHLKAKPDAKHAIEVNTLYCDKYNRMLDVGLVRKIKNGREIYAQINHETGFLFEPAFFINEKGFLEPITSAKQFDDLKNEDYSYDEKMKCHRIKRGIALGKMCADSTPADSHVDNMAKTRIMQQLPKINNPPVWFDKKYLLSTTISSSGVVFADPADPTRVIKFYKHSTDDVSNYKAMNNLEAFNRLYSSAASKNKKAISSVFTSEQSKKYIAISIPKIEGAALSDILKDKNHSEIMKIVNKITSTDIVQELVTKLAKNNINTHDLNIGNTMYDYQNDAFNLVDFDEAWVKNDVSSNQYDMMYKSLRSAIMLDFLVPLLSLYKDIPTEYQKVQQAIKAMN